MHTKDARSDSNPDMRNMGSWWVPCLLCTSVFLLGLQPSRGLPAVALPVTSNPRGWQAAADAARTSAALAVQSVKHQRPRIHERESSLVKTASTCAVAHDAAARAAATSPGEPPSVQRLRAGRDNQTFLAGLTAVPLLLLVIAAAFSAGYAVGRGRQSRTPSELRELEAAKYAVQQLAQPAARCASTSHGSVSAARLGPAPHLARSPDAVTVAEHEEHGSASASTPNAGANAPAAADAAAGDGNQQDSRNMSLLDRAFSEASAYVDHRPASALGDTQNTKALSDGQPIGSSIPDCEAAPSRSASSSAMLPHPVSGLVFLSHAVSGCSDSLETPASNSSRAGIDDVLAADATSVVSPRSCQGGGLPPTHAQQQPNGEGSSAMDAPLGVCAKPEPPGDPNPALSRAMRHPRSMHSTVDACTDPAELVRAGGATEQVMSSLGWSDDCLGFPPMSNGSHGEWSCLRKQWLPALCGHVARVRSACAVAGMGRSGSVGGRHGAAVARGPRRSVGGGEDPADQRRRRRLADLPAAVAPHRLRQVDRQHADGGCRT